MKIQTFSVVVGGSKCNAKCPYCVSKLTGCTDGVEQGQQPMEINKRNFHKACNFAKQSGVSTILLTGKGEPLVYQNHITRYLEMIENWMFPFVELQTNGVLLKDISDVLLKDWYAAGLTTICLSCVSPHPAENKEIFGKDIRLLSNIARLHELGFSVRVSCVGVGGITDSTIKVREFAMWCAMHDVEQFTWRPVTNISIEETEGDSDKRGVYDWINLNRVEEVDVKQIQDWFDFGKNATKLLELAHGATVYDYRGQNVSISNCLTRSTNPDDIRQLIFFPDGHLRYDWTKQGAIII